METAPRSHNEQLDRDGFAILRAVLPPNRVDDALAEVCRALERQSEAEGALRREQQLYAARNLRRGRNWRFYSAARKSAGYLRASSRQWA